MQSNGHQRGVRGIALALPGLGQAPGVEALLGRGGSNPRVETHHVAVAISCIRLVALAFMGYLFGVQARRSGLGEGKRHRVARPEAEAGDAEAVRRQGCPGDLREDAILQAAGTKPTGRDG